MTDNTKLITVLAKIQDGINLLDVGVPQHLAEHPELDSDSVRVIVEMHSTVKMLHRLTLHLAEENMNITDRVQSTVESIRKK